MNEYCRSFCPVAASCVAIHQDLEQTLQGAEQEDQSARVSLRNITTSIAASEAIASFETAKLHLLREGAYTPPTGVETAAEKALESILEHKENIQKNVPLFEEAQAKAAQTALAKTAVTASLEQSHVAMGMLDSAQETCPGPKLTAKGIFVFTRAIVTAWLFDTSPPPPEANIRYLFKKGYVKCVNAEAHEAAAISQELKPAA